MKHHTTLIRWIVVIAVLGAVIAFFASGLHRQLDLATLKGRMDQLDAWYQTHPLLLAGAFFLLYVTVTALSLPLATLLTLAAGAVFGLLEGTDRKSVV